MARTTARNFEFDLATLSAKTKHLYLELEELYQIDSRDATIIDLWNLRTAARLVAKARGSIAEIGISEKKKMAAKMKKANAVT